MCVCDFCVCVPRCLIFAFTFAFCGNIASIAFETLLLFVFVAFVCEQTQQTLTGRFGPVCERKNGSVIKYEDVSY